MTLPSLGGATHVQAFTTFAAAFSMAALALAHVALHVPRGIGRQVSA